MVSKGVRTKPKTREFRVEDLAAARPTRIGYYAQLFEELKTLAPAGKGLVVEFASESAGSAAIKRMAGWGAEDGWNVYQRKVGVGDDQPERYVWVAKVEEEPE
jgi:hypothetical protein